LQEIGYLGSQDEQPRKHVSGALVDPTRGCPPETALYLHNDSVLPVIVERLGDRFFFKPKPEEREKFEQRAASSFLVVYRMQPGEKFDSRKEVRPEEFMHVMFPRDVWENCPEDVKALVTPPMTIIDNNVERVIGGVLSAFTMNVPDYETEVRKLFKEGNNAPILLHGVRLPIPGEA